MEQISYEDSRKEALQGIEDMFLSVENPFGNFKKEAYEKGFQSYLYEHRKTLDCILALCEDETELDRWCSELAEHLVDAVENRLKEITRKSKRDQQQLNNNMILVTYVIPAIMDRRGSKAEAVADAIVNAWNQRFQTSVSRSTYEKIQEGFHRKLCYITTAVCESLGKGDDCYELNLLRNYRDTYLRETEEGRALVEEYYDIAPTIVTRIDKSEHAAQLYQAIWSDYLKPCIRDLEEQHPEACKSRYMAMVKDLKGRYIA